MGTDLQMLSYTLQRALALQNEQNSGNAGTSPDGSLPPCFGGWGWHRGYADPAYTQMPCSSRQFSKIFIFTFLSSMPVVTHRVLLSDAESLGGFGVSRQ